MTMSYGKWTPMGRLYTSCKYTGGIEHSINKIYFFITYVSLELFANATVTNTLPNNVAFFDCRDTPYIFFRISLSGKRHIQHKISKIRPIRIISISKF